MLIEFPVEPDSSERESDARNPLPASLKGAVVGLLDNSKAGANVIIDTFGAWLKEREPSIELLKARKRTGSWGMTEEVRKSLTTASLVVAALGDCGACSSWLIHDAVSLERDGIPVIVVCSEPFETFAHAQAAALGMADLRIILIGHPIADLTDDEVRTEVAKIYDQFDRVMAEAEDAAGWPSQAAPLTSTAAAVVSAEVPAEVDVFDFLASRGILDGLPVVAPTPERVAAMVAEHAGDPDALIGRMAPKYGAVTPRALATVAVMAGCLPSYFPVVVAAIEATLDPDFNLNGIQATTHPVGVFTLVSGPIVNEIGMNSGINAFGQGNRANATIGRAVRLAMVAIGGARPGNGDMATLGTPGKYTFAAAENVPESPWGALAESLGYPADANVVTVFGAEEPQNANDHESTTGLGVLRMVAGTMRSTGHNNSYYVEGQVLVVFSPEHAATVAEQGYTRRDVQEYLFQEARTPVTYFSEANIRQRLQTRFPREYNEYGPHATVPVVHSPENILIAVVGGPGKHTMFIPTFGATRATSAVVRPRAIARADV